MHLQVYGGRYLAYFHWRGSEHELEMLGLVEYLLHGHWISRYDHGRNDGRVNVSLLCGYVNGRVRVNDHVHESGRGRDVRVQTLLNRRCLLGIPEC